MNYYSAPVRVSIDLTYICDLRCIHCRTNTGEIPDEIMRKMLNFEQIKELILDLDEMGTFEITLTGGEPSLHKHFWEIVDLIKLLKKSSVTLITNAAALKSGDFDRIIDSGIRSIRVSIDGTREKFHEIRKKDVFSNVMRNVKYINSRISNFKILTTVMTTNIDNVFELVEYLRGEGIKKLDLILVRAHGRGGRNQLTLSENQVMEVKQKTIKFQSQVDRNDFELCLNAPYLDSTDMWGPIYDVVMYPYLKKNTSLAISGTGDVTMSRLYSPFPIGNVKTMSIKEIWKSGQESLANECSNFSEEALREVFWNFNESKTNDSQHSALLDRQIFENAEVL